MEERSRRPAPKKEGAEAQKTAEHAPGQPGAAKKKHGRVGRILLALLKILVVCMCLAIIAGCVMAVMVSNYLVKATADDDELLDLENLKLSYSSAIYVKNSTTGEWYEYQKLVDKNNRTWVELGDVPKMVQNAFVAAEDQNFWTHSGFSIKRNVYAVLNEASYALTGRYLGGRKQGASTIDQQLVKNLLDDDANTGTEGYQRKIREIFRAYILDKRYTKDTILEAYLNVIALTGNTAGVEAGAQSYFGKDVGDLNLQEAASLACITNNPTKYNPRTNPESHLERRNYVLECMYDQGYITKEEYETAAASPLELVEDKETTAEETTAAGEGEQTDSTAAGTTPYTSTYSWFSDKVIDDVVGDLMEQKGWSREDASYYVYNSGIKIYATMVPEVQAAMEQTMANAEMFPAIEATDSAGKTVTPQAAMATINYQGELCGVVGSLGTKTEDRAFDRATDAVRPVGSTMKPIGVYALGIEYDYITYSSGIMDSPIQVPASKLDANTGSPNAMVDWPDNYSKTYTNEPMTVATAIAKSINTVAVRVEQMVTPENSYEFLSNTLQISSLLYPNDVDYSPMALGGLSYGISPYQMAGAYMIFGNGGTFTTLHSYTSVEDRTGEVILEPVIVTTQAISGATSYIMNRALYGVLHGGTGNGLYVRDDMESVGKTGTTSDNCDHWFMGLTPYYVTATWWGYDEQNMSLDWKASQYRIHPPTLAWRQVMEAAQANLEWKAFPSSDDVQEITYCTVSGCVAGQGCIDAGTTAKGYYKKDGRQPDAVCTVHGG